MFKVSDTLIHAIIILSLSGLTGLLVVAVFYAWDWAFTKILEVLGVKKCFVEFLIKKYRDKRVTKQKME